MDRVEVVAVAHERDVDVADGHRERLAVRRARSTAQARAKLMRSAPVTFFSSSASTVAISRSSSSRDADLADDVVEEAVHDEATGLVLGDAARLQVEQLLVVEAAGRRRVAGALDLAGLDLEVRHRVGAAAVGEDEVAVLLVGLDALGDLADQHVADPHGVRALALQRALVDDVAARVRRVVVDEEPVLEVLAGVGEVEPEQLGRAARAGVVDGGVDPDDVAAEGDRHVLVRRVATDARVVLGRGGRRRRPSPAGDTSVSVRAVADVRSRRPAPAWPSRVAQHDDGLASGCRTASTTWPASAGLGDLCRSTSTGSALATSVSAGTSTSSVLGASASTRAADRVFGTRPEMPRSAWRSSPPTSSTRTPSAASTGRQRRRRRPARASSCRPRSRLSGVNRQISSRPFGTGWSASRTTPPGAGGEATRPSTAFCTAAAALSVTVTDRAFVCLLVDGHGREP